MWQARWDSFRMADDSSGSLFPAGTSQSQKARQDLVCRLAGQPALPDAGEQFFELSEMLGTKLSAPLALDVAEYVVDF